MYHGRSLLPRPLLLPARPHSHADTGVRSRGAGLKTQLPTLVLSPGITSSVQVVALDPLGNRSPAQGVQFAVDTTPPVLEQLVVPQAVSGSLLAISWEAADGAQGSGVADIECRQANLVCVSVHAQPGCGQIEAIWLQSCQPVYHVESLVGQP